MVAMVIKLSGWLWLVTLCVASVCCSGCHWFWRSRMFISGYDEPIDILTLPRGYEDKEPLLFVPLPEFGSGVIWDAFPVKYLGTMSVRSLSGQVLAEYTECQLDRIPARQNRWIVSPSGLYAVRRRPHPKALRDLLKKRQPTVEPKRGQELPLRRDTGP